MAQSIEREGIEIWELSVAVIFFLSVLSGIIYVFDEQQYETTLFVKEFKEIVTTQVENSTITFKKPEFIEISKNKNEFQIKNEDKTYTIETNKEISMNVDRKFVTLNT